MNEFITQFAALVSAGGVTAICGILWSFNRRLTKIEIALQLTNPRIRKSLGGDGE